MTEEELEGAAETAEETPEDAYAELEAKVKLLQDENLSPAEIIKKIYEEDYNTDTNALAKIMGMTAFDVGRVKAHARHPSKKSAGERLKKFDKISDSGAEAGKPGSVYKTDTDMNSILKEILSTHPDVTERQILEIMSWAKMTPGGLQPAHLYALLSSMKGLDKNAASMLAQKYQLALAKAQQESGQQSFGFGPIPISPQQPQQQQQFMWPLVSTGGQPGVALQPPPPGYYSKEQVDELIEKRDQKRDIEDLKDTVAGLREEIPKLIKENIPQTQMGTEYEEEITYLDAENKPVPREQATHYKTIKRPISTRQSADFKALEGKIDSLQQSIQDKKVEALTAEVKELKEAKAQPATEDPKLKELKDEILATRKELQETKDKISAEDKKRLEDKIGSLENQMGNLNARLASSGVNSPEGVMSTAITTFGNRKPGEKAIDMVREILAPGVVAPVPQEVVPSGAGVLAEEAGKRGLVTIVRDRIRR